MSSTIAAMDPETLKNLALGLSGGSLVLALIALKVISSVVGKAISTVVLLAVALAGYSQREEIAACIDTVRNSGATTVPTEISCQFFGQDISVNVPVP
jgi:hypothetical protein